MWWLVAAGLAVLGLVFWQAVVARWEARGWLEGGYPLLMVLVRDCAGVVEGLLRAVLRRLTWSSRRDWDVMVLDAGSRDDTPQIARRLLRGTGVTFVQSGAEWWRLIEEAADRGRPILLVPLLDTGTAPGGAATARRVAGCLGPLLGLSWKNEGNGRILSPGAELHD